MMLHDNKCAALLLAMAVAVGGCHSGRDRAAEAAGTYRGVLPGNGLMEIGLLEKGTCHYHTRNSRGDEMTGDGVWRCDSDRSTVAMDLTLTVKFANRPDPMTLKPHFEWPLRPAADGQLTLVDTDQQNLVLTRAAPPLR